MTQAILVEDMPQQQQHQQQQQGKKRNHAIAFGQPLEMPTTAPGDPLAAASIPGLHPGNTGQEAAGPSIKKRRRQVNGAPPIQAKPASEPAQAPQRPNNGDAPTDQEASAFTQAVLDRMHLYEESFRRKWVDVLERNGTGIVARVQDLADFKCA